MQQISGPAASKPTTPVSGPLQAAMPAASFPAHDHAQQMERGALANSGLDGALITDDEQCRVIGLVRATAEVFDRLEDAGL